MVALGEHAKDALQGYLIKDALEKDLTKSIFKGYLIKYDLEIEDLTKDVLEIDNKGTLKRKKELKKYFLEVYSGNNGDDKRLLINININCNNITIYKQINNINNNNSCKYFILAAHPNARGNKGLVNNLEIVKKQTLEIQECLQEIQDCLKCLYLKNRIAIIVSK